ncbi:MAG TPA: glycosyltransferase family 2 protein [Xanthobacteraceae bacterium]|nr:glycosyltransferase family 2 protein [Xanthobacteraceae bacterium]
MSVWVVIAAFNEARVIADVVAGVARLGYQVVVVDDGSTDETVQRAAPWAHTVRHPVNLGQGAALQTGIDFALQQGAEVIVTFDADGQHRAADIEPLVAALREQAADFALGSRFLGRAIAISTSRRLLLRAATLFTQLTTGLRLTDTHNGLRAMTRLGATRIRLRQNRMAHASEILAQIAASRLPYVEVPVRIEYTAYSVAKGQRLGDAFTILLDLFARRLTR